MSESDDKDLPITITPEWKAFLRSIGVDKFKRVCFHDPASNSKFDYVILRSEDFLEWAKQAGLTLKWPGESPVIAAYPADKRKLQ